MDIAGCEYRAEHGVPRDSAAADTAKKTLLGGAGGAAIGAVAGAITGNAGTGAAIGAATGATAGLLKGAYDSTKPDETWQGYVEACLRDKGYEVIGWK
jgi:outer membrane lipoprotein SlyB